MPTPIKPTANNAFVPDQQADDAHTHSALQLNAPCIFFGLPLGLGHMPAGSAAKIYWINPFTFLHQIFAQFSYLSFSIFALNIG